MSRGRDHLKRRLSIALAIAISVPLLPPTAGIAAAATPTPAASWDFDEGAGSTAHDAVGDLDGTVAGGAGWTAVSPFQGASALSLDHAGGRVTVSNGSALEPASYLGISVWVRTTDSAGGLIAEKGDAGCDVGTWRLREWGGLPTFEYRMAGSGVQVAQGPYGAYNDGAWHHVAVLVEEASGFATVYVDGRAGHPVYILGTGLDYDYAGLSTDDLIVGSPETCADPYLTPTADVDDLRIYGTQLLPDDLWDMEPSYPTTTTVAVLPAAPFADERVSFNSTISPVPPVTTVMFHYSRDGGPEQIIPGSSPSNDGYAGWAFGYLGLPAGHYVLSAEFPGVGPAQPSTSDPVEFTISKRATVTTMGPPNNVPIRPGDGFVLNPSTTWTVPQQGGYPSGPFTLYDVTGDTPVQVATYGGCSAASSNGACVGILNVPGLDVGTYRFRATFEGNAVNLPSESGDVEVVVSQHAPVLGIQATPNPVQAHHVSDVEATVYLPGESNQPSEGTLLIRDVDTNTVLTSVDAPATSLQVELPPLSIGAHHLRAEWSGNAQYLAGSASTTLQVVPDIAEATGVGLSTSAFYPVVDGYRDTVTARGTRNEPLSVAIVVRNSAGSVVRTGSIARAGGAYGWSWNGKNSAGTLQAAGTYSITQVLKDAFGSTTTVRTNVYLSRKKLYWYSLDLYKTAAQYQKRSTSWGAWLFTMPSATSYRYMKLYVYGKRAVGANGVIGAQDNRPCAFSSISPNCVWRHAQLSTTLTWSSISLSSTYERSGRYVRAYAEALWGSISVAKLRLHLQYAVLK